MASALVTTQIAVARAFSPGHVTGFFEVPGQQTNPLHKGSKGAGFSIDAGISTAVHLYEGKGSEILINGKAAKARETEVSQWVVDQYLRDESYFAKVDHDVGIPVGFGLGSSGAAALSTSYALNAALGSKLSATEAAQLAHRAEIACRTGLGTVIAEYSGGFELRRTAGAPCIGTIDSIPLANYKAVILCMAPISTRAFLANRMDEINGLGGKMLARLSESRDVNEFLEMSFQFAQTLGLTEGRCRAPLEALRAAGIPASVALFGQTVFTLVPEERAVKAAGALKGFGGTVLVCNIGTGARVLKDR